MKTCIALLMSLGILTLILVLWPKSSQPVKQSLEAEPEAAVVKPADRSQDHRAPEAVPRAPQPVLAVPAATVFSTNAAISCAQEMVEIIQSLPVQRASARNQMETLAATLFISDWIMECRRTGKPVTPAEVAAAFSAATGLPGKLVTDRLSQYSRFQETLSQHYNRCLENNPELKAVSDVVAKSGVGLNYESDLLIDCWRLVALRTDAQEFSRMVEQGLYDQALARASEAAPHVDAAAAWGSAPPGQDAAQADPRAESKPVEGSSIERVGAYFGFAQEGARLETLTTLNAYQQTFAWRFQNRHGLDNAAAQQLIQSLLPLNIRSAAPPDFQVPVL